MVNNLGISGLKKWHSSEFFDFTLCLLYIMNCVLEKPQMLMGIDLKTPPRKKMLLSLPTRMVLMETK